VSPLTFYLWVVCEDTNNGRDLFTKRIIKDVLNPSQIQITNLSEVNHEVQNKEMPKILRMAIQVLHQMMVDT
jgi:hypothetical protein